MKTTPSLILLTLGVASLSLHAADPDQNWPQWRGPKANGTAPAAKPPVTWSETNNIKWKVKLPGSGTATPIIWEKQIFIQTAIPTGKKPQALLDKDSFNPRVAVAGLPQAEPPPPGGPGGRRRPGGPGGPGGGGGGRSEKPTEAYQFALLSIDRETGKTQWQKVANEVVPHEGHHRDHGFSSHSPITDGKLVFAWFGSRGLHCYDLAGNLKWEKDFGRMQTRNSFGEGTSPALFGDTIVVNWDHEGEDFIAALDKNTGKELWRNARDEETTWTTPLIVQHNGKAQVIVTATKKTRSYDLLTGKQIWECGGMTGNVVPSPVTGFGMVYAISGFRGAALQAIKLSATGDITGTDAIAWQHGKSTPYVPSPLLYGERLYFHANNNAILSCFDAKTGKAWFDAERLEGPSGIYSSPIGADGRIYVVGRNGVSVVLKDSPKLEVLATNRLTEEIDASPVAVGKELFLRGHESLYCISEK